MRLVRAIADLDGRVERQLAAIEAGVDPVLVGERIQALKAERDDKQTALAGIAPPAQDGVPRDDAFAVRDGLPDLRPIDRIGQPTHRRRSTTRSASPPRSTATPANYD